MASNDITPREGLSDFWVEFDTLKQLPQRGGAIVTFRIVRITNPNEETQATLSFHVPPKNDGTAGVMARGYDQLIDAMRQMVYQADSAREQYKEEAALYVRAQKDSA